MLMLKMRRMNYVKNVLYQFSMLHFEIKFWVVGYITDILSTDIDTIEEVN